MRRKTAILDNLENQPVVFQEKAILRIWHNEEWWLAVVAVAAVLPTRFNQTRMSRIYVVTRSWPKG